MSKEQRLIYADKRIAEIKKLYCDGCDNYGGAKCRACWVDDAICLIEDATTADVAPVQHGRWEWFEEWNLSTPDHPTELENCGWRCSECKTPIEDTAGGYWDDAYDEPTLKYCPECGAKMDF